MKKYLFNMAVLRSFRHCLLLPAILLSLCLSAHEKKRVTASISGSQSVSTGSTEYYQANFTVGPDPLSIIAWNVTGGTITSQNVNPNSGVIYCYVQWSSTPTAGSVSIYEDLGSQNAELPVDIGNYAFLQSIFGTPGTRTEVDCNPINVSCNLITNNNFTPDPNHSLDDPFTEGDIAGWTSSHGTPQVNIYPGLQPPSPATGYAFIATFGESTATGEGIAQKIPGLINGRTYRLTFYMRFCPWLGTNPANQVDNLYAAFIKCDDFNQFPTQTFNTPAFPTSSQIVYHGTSISNQTWVLVERTFTADDDYDMIWLFPDQNTNTGVYSTIAIAYPVLTEWPLPAVTPAGPIDYYIPLDFACPSKLILTSAAVVGNQWYKNGQAIQGATGQTLTLGYASGQCVSTGGQYYAIANGCQSNVVTVNIHYYGYGTYGEEVANLGAIYHPVSSPNFYCLNTNDKIRNFNLGANTTYTWSFTNITYPNNPANITLDNNTYNPSSPVADVIIGNNPYEGTMARGVADNNGVQKIIDYHIYQTPYIDPVYGNDYTVCSTTVVNVNVISSANTGFYAPWQYIKPGGSNFDFERYEFGSNTTVLNSSYFSNLGYVVSTNPWIIQVPGGSQLAQSIQVQFSGTSSIIKTFFNNNANEGCAEERIDIVAAYSGCLRMIHGNVPPEENEIAETTIIYPNPAIYSTTVTSKNLITKVVITDQYGRVRRTIETRNSNSVNIDISVLQPGIYSCAVSTDKGIEQLKLLIQR